MTRSSRYVPRNYRWFNKLLKMTYGVWLRVFYRIRIVHGELTSLRPPYVVVANHVSIYDPFVLGILLHEPIYWVTSDGNMRTRIMKALLRLVGSIPKSKAIPDIETINWIVEVIRKRRGAVGLFPEGQASWDGNALPLFPSTAKLLKILKVPVLAAVIRGGYLSRPRWSNASRRGLLEIEFRVLFTPADLKALPPEEILVRLEKALDHDESLWQVKEGIRFDSRQRAENIESAFYVCPSCEAIGTLHSFRNRLECRSCGGAWILDRGGRIRVDIGAKLSFATPRGWNQFQSASLGRRIEAAVLAAASPAIGDLGESPIFSDSDLFILRGFRARPLQRLARGELLLFTDRMEFRGDARTGKSMVFPIDAVEGIGVLKRALLEFYIGRDLYQVRFPSRSTSARKWLDAVTILAKTRNGKAAE
jgi:1-acyl-sn-glycerol-3-phosphate acyltransferase